MDIATAAVSGNSPEDVVPREQLACIERLDSTELRSMVLQLLEENHRLQNRLSREREAKEVVEQKGREQILLLEMMGNQLAEKSAAFDSVCGQKGAPTDEQELLCRWRRKCPELATPRRPIRSHGAAAAPRRPWPLQPRSASARPQSERPAASAVVALAVEMQQTEKPARVRDILPYRAGAEPAILQRAPRFDVVVRVMHGAVLKGAHWADQLWLSLSPDACVAEVEQLLMQGGVRFEPARPHDWAQAHEHEDCQLGEGLSRLLLGGARLRRDVPLKEQGVTDGTELKLFRAKGFPERLRSREGHEPRAPRGLLMTPGAAPWAPTAARQGPDDFFSGMAPEDEGKIVHLTDLAYTKVGKKPAFYLDA